MNRKLLSLAGEARLPLVVTLVSGLLAGWLTIGQARGLSLVMDGVFLGGQGWKDVQGLMLAVAGVIAARALLAWTSEVSANAVAARVKAGLRERLFAKIQALGPGFTQGERTGELTTAAVEGVEALDAYFSQYLPQLVLSAVVPLSVLVFVFPLDPLSGVVLLVTAPLIPLFMYLIGKGAEIVTRRQYETLGRLSAHFLDSLQGLVTLKVFGRSKAQAASIREASDQFRDITLSVLRITFLSALALELIATVSTAVVAVEVGLRLLYGHLSFDKAMFLLILAPEFYIPLRMLGLRFHAGMAGTSAARRIYAILDLNEENDGKMKNDRPVPTPFQTISLSHLTFTYPGMDTPTLEDICLEMRAGERIALTGTSGAGKSTLAALLLGFHFPSEGEIRVDGIPLQDLPLEAWRQNIAWVPQNPHLFHGTITENLRVARPEAGKAELEAAARAANLDGFIHSLPQGYETMIGEDGARLSGGQAQRLALARAFLKDARLLILDEPTSALDPRTEYELEQSTRALMEGRTVLTIAHRLNTITQADRIVVLNESRVVEVGTHAELAKAGGHYARLLDGRNAGEPSREEMPSPTGMEPVEVEADLPGPGLDTGTRPGAGVLPRLLGFLSGSWAGVGLSVLLGALTIAASTGLMGAASWLISTAALHPSIAELNIAVVGVRFFGISRGVTRYLERLTSHGVTFRLLSRLRAWFYEKVEPQAPAIFERFRSGDLHNRILADVETLEGFYVRGVAPPLVAAVISAGTALFLGGIHGGLGWTYLGTAGLLGLALPFLSWLASRRPGMALAEVRGEVRLQAIDLVQGMADLSAFGRVEDQRLRLRRLGRGYGRAQNTLARVSGLSNAAGLLLTNLGMWSILAYCIFLVRRGSLEGVMLAVLPLLALASLEALQPLPASAQTLATSLAAGRRLFEVADGGREAGGQEETRRTIQVNNPTLRVERLSFTYPGAGSPALVDLDLDLPEGRKTAVVGPSGAGKSTLVNLLLRFQEAPKGSIRIAGGDIREYAEEAVRSLFSVIPQRTHLFNASIRENLLLADREADQDRLEQAARMAGIHEFIASLPMGYETQAREGGVRFSGGERQRLAIARALLRNAPILLLDEPAAHLDAPTARGILENLLRNTGKRSLLLITHRLMGLEEMDEIIVLENGRVVERGTHANLVRRGGLYAQMYSLQESALEKID